MWSWAEHSENADMEKMTVASIRVPIKVSVALGKMSSFILGRRTTKIEPTGTEWTFNSVTFFTAKHTVVFLRSSSYDTSVQRLVVLDADPHATVRASTAVSLWF